MKYGGDAGPKYPITFDKNIWMIKYPKNTKTYNKPQISYTTSPLSEYIGSKVYESLGIPVHETLLGTRNGKVVVACKDFTHTSFDTDNFTLLTTAYGADYIIEKTARLDHFHDIKNDFMASDLDEYTGTGSETLMNEVLDTINGDEGLQAIGGVLERFWDMFVVDAFIGNNDRNNGNWGVLLDYSTRKMSLAPVYDNGSSFFKNSSFASMEKDLADENAMFDKVITGYSCRHKYAGTDNEGIPIHPFRFIHDGENADCNAAVHRFLERIEVGMGKIEAMIAEIPEACGVLSVMPQIQKDFYIKVMHIRLDYLRECAEKNAN